MSSRPLAQLTTPFQRNLDFLADYHAKLTTCAQMNWVINEIMVTQEHFISGMKVRGETLWVSQWYWRNVLDAFEEEYDTGYLPTVESFFGLPVSMHIPDNIILGEE